GRARDTIRRAPSTRSAPVSSPEAFMSRLLTARLAALLALGFAATPALAQGHAAHDASAAARGAAPAAGFRAIPGANLVTITARDFAFDAPARIPAGLTTL